MNNQSLSSEPFQKFSKEEAHRNPILTSSHNSLHQSADEEAKGGQRQPQNGPLLHLPQPILESSRQGGNGSWDEGETSRQQQEPLSQQIDMRNAQHITGQDQMGSVNPPIPISTVPVQQMVPQPTTMQYPPSPRINLPQKPTEVKSLDNMRKVTQQSFAPSQKTIVLNHISSQINNGVYHSHVSTERMPVQPQRQPNTRHSHHDPRMGSPARINFDHAQAKPQPLFSSYIPGMPSSNAPQVSERQHQPEEVSFWRGKYDELVRRWQATRAKQAKEQEVALSKFVALQKNYQLLQANYDQLLDEYHAKLDQNQQYFQQLQNLQGTLNQLNLSSDTGERQRLEAQMMEAEQRHEQEMREMHEHATMLQMEVEQREAQLRERTLKTSAMRRSENSQLLLDRSRMDSFENTRLMQLQMHVGKLNAQLTMREQSFQRELRLANLSVAELADRLKAVTAEKDQTIRTLQQKVGLLESDLNRKDSIVRTLRDQAARHITPAASVYSSAVGEREGRVGEDVRRELDNVRRTLFERERQKLILKQKIEEAEERAVENQQVLARRKQENQVLRRQLNQLEGLHHENEQLKDVLQKKKAELAQMRDMLLQKQQHAGDFENLSKENQRLRGFMLKKNEELSQLSSRLYDQEKRAREAEMAHSPQIRELQEEMNRLQDAIARKDLEIDKLNQSLQLVQANFSEVEFELERHRNINQEYEAQIRLNMGRVVTAEQELAQCQAHIQHLQAEIEQLQSHLQESETELQNVNRQLQMARAELAQERELLQMEQVELKEFKQKSTKELQQFECKQGDLQVRCKELEALLRNKEQRLVRAERDVEESREQLRKHQGCGRQLEEMAERMAQYQMRIISLTLNRSPYSLSQYPPPSQIFQNKLIYSLKQQNESLKQQLSTSKAVSSRQPPSERGSFIKQRLGEFGNRLEDAIGGGLKRVKSVETLSRRQGKETVQQQNIEIERLKKLAQQMQQVQQDLSSNRKAPSVEHLQQLYQEQLIFLRSSNQALENRITQLLRLNKELKLQLQDAMQVRDSSVKSYYQQQVGRLQREVVRLRRGSLPGPA